MRGPNDHRRVQMERMQNKSNLQVTFSKRRDGVFEKATELSTLCGADVFVVDFSPRNKQYSFRNPSVESIMNRFLEINPPTNTDVANPVIIAHQNANIDEINVNLNRLEISLEKGKNMDKHFTHQGKNLQLKLVPLTLKNCARSWKLQMKKFKEY
uniref:MADS-box domain-containing protein n=1 Tax=Solanum lycopersicum TaxID=4081 RepID=A0A3Q7IW92_SOLLC